MEGTGLPFQLLEPTQLLDLSADLRRDSGVHASQEVSRALLWVPTLRVRLLDSFFPLIFLPNPCLPPSRGHRLDILVRCAPTERPGA